MNKTHDFIVADDMLSCYKYPKRTNRTYHIYGANENNKFIPFSINKNVYIGRVLDNGQVALGYRSYLKYLQTL